MTKTTSKPRRLAVIDLETDPFQWGTEIAPFAAGVIIEGHGFFSFWGDQCVTRVMAFLESIEEPLLIYAHNGGKFDFYFFLEYLQNPLKIINGRVVKAKFGRHEFRDSYSIIPVSLQEFDKLKIDYGKFTRDNREHHRAEILRYLQVDCEQLFTLVAAFRERFGDKLTIASTAIKELERFHPQEYLGPSHDARFREFYFGGRVEYFKQGILPGPWKVYDVNSMYPSVMRNAWHPLGREYVTTYGPALTPAGWIQGYPGRMYFAEVVGTNRGALPVRTPEGLSFTESHGVFKTTSHELVSACALGKFEVERVNWAMIPMRWQNFRAYVDHWQREKLAAEKRADKIGRYFAKTIQNSSYGKFGQNPAEYKDYFLEVFANTDAREVRKRLGFDPDSTETSNWGLYECHPQYRVWRKPSAGGGAYRDVAIAASITSAARAVLMRALAGAREPVYCDTDSIICMGLSGVPRHAKALGAWKLEASGDRIAIAGKKLYALRDGREVVKIASKGVKVSANEIERVARGGEVVWRSDVPNFSLVHETRYIERRIVKKGVTAKKITMHAKWKTRTDKKKWTRI